jgi:hypothetical protein
MSRIGNSLSEIKQIGSNEISEASMPQKASIAATAVTLALEWGTFNEGAIGYVAGNVLRQTHDVLLTATAAGAVSFTEQSIFGLTAAVSINNFPKVMGAIRGKISGNEDPITIQEIPEELNKDEATSTSRIKSLGNRALTAFSIGTSLKVMKDNALEQRSLADNARNVITDAGLIAGGVVGVAATAAGATNLGRSVGLGSEANIFADVISNPFTYLGLFGIKSAFDIKSWVYKRNENIANNTAELTEAVTDL